jgi:hypothetical protein
MYSEKVLIDETSMQGWTQQKLHMWELLQYRRIMVE